MLSKGEEYIDNEYYSYNRRFFRLIGLWQYQTTFKQVIYICFINYILTGGSFVQVYYLFTSERNLITITKLLETTFLNLCFGLYYYNMLFNDGIMKKIRYRIKCDWEILQNKPELKILKKYAEVSRRCTIIIAICFYLYAAFLIFPSALRNFRYIFGSMSYTELTLPFYVEYFMKNQMKYYFGLFVEYVIIIIGSTIGIANYSMFIAVIQHACALFSIVEWRVNERFRKPPENFYYANNKNELAEEIEWIVDIIQNYNKAIKFVELLKSFYEAINLLEEFLMFICIMIDYFYVFYSTLNRIECLIKLHYVIGSFFIIYIHFYLAQKLIDHNDDVFIQFCQIPFYSLSLSTQKLLPLLIMKSMRKCSLSLTSAIVISHDLFAKSIRKSLSFAMILFNLQ